MKDTTLYFSEGKSDKVYRAWIEPGAKGLFSVNAAWGRRGSTMQSGSKGQFPLDEAESTHMKLIAEKISKGYRPGENATPVVIPAKSTASNESGSGWLVPPMLLNEISNAELCKIIDDDRWCAQMKWDGIRAQIHRKLVGDTIDVRAFSRTNKPIALPKPVVDAVIALEPINTDLVLDGELVGDTANLFDVLKRGATSLLEFQYQNRYTALEKLMSRNKSKALVLTPTFWEHKNSMLDTLREIGAEGIVFKRVDAKYESGRPNSGGPALKYKFWATASVIVAGPNGTKSSVEIMLADGTKIGHVTIAPNQKMPPTGSVIEVRYLYAHRGGSLIQTTLLRVREDVPREACTIAQLEFKGEVRQHV